MKTHLWNYHHLRLLRLLRPLNIPTRPNGSSKAISLTFGHAFDSKATVTSSPGSRHGQLGSSFHPPAASCLARTRAEIFGLMGSEPLRESENCNDYKQDIIPTLSATFKCSGEIVDEMMEALMSFGASSVSIEDDDSIEILEEKVLSIGPVAWDREKRQFWKKSKVVALFPPGHNVEESIAFAFNSIGLNILPYEVKEVEHQNWVQQVKDTFQPLKISDSLWIIPEWSSPPDASAVNIVLQPGLAFGTGSHPTTRLCLQWLNHIVKGGERIMDYGTGSGILAVSALKLGAGQAVGIDIDPIAVSSARHNAKLNGFECNSFQVFQTGTFGDDPTPFGDAKFDIVVANILLNPLLELSTEILGCSRPKGFLGVSGILEVQVEQVLQRYSPYLENIEVTAEDGWVFISGTKRITL